MILLRLIIGYSVEQDFEKFKHLVRFSYHLYCKYGKDLGIWRKIGDETEWDGSLYFFTGNF